MLPTYTYLPTLSRPQTAYTRCTGMTRTYLPTLSRPQTAHTRCTGMTPTVLTDAQKTPDGAHEVHGDDADRIVDA